MKEIYVNKVDLLEDNKTKDVRNRFRLKSK